MAYAILADGRDGRELEELDAKIGMTEDPERIAMDMLRKQQEEAGMVPSAQVPSWSGDGGDEEFT